MKISKTLLVIFLLAGLAISAGVSLAASNKLVYSAWVPYWKKTGGVAETLANLDKLNEISPFSYTMSADGKIVDTAKIGEEPWTGLFKAARAKKIKILPSILWNNSVAIHKTLSNAGTRQNHINDILAEVQKRNFDGIDIDYENKYASTSPYFNFFLRDLGASLHVKGKQLSCTIEARTPPASRYLTIPKVIEYANDYPAINKYCDQVRLMAYPQGTVDIKLNMARRLGGFYYPISDQAWVNKVLDLAIKDINPRKIMLGIPTYGYELEVTDKNKYFDYSMVRSLSYKDLQQLATQTKVQPKRDNAGELALVYRTPDGKIRFASFSDSEAMLAKVRLAKMYNLRGVTIFKVDGESDAYWRYMN